MPLWTYTTPPEWISKLPRPSSNEAVATEAGWQDPVTGEVYVCIEDLATRTGAAIILFVLVPGNPPIISYGQTLIFLVQYNQTVRVTGSPAVTFQISGQTRTAIYSGGSGTQNLTFSYTIGTTDGGPITIAEPIIASGTIVGVLNSVEADPTFTIPALLPVVSTVHYISSTTLVGAAYMLGDVGVAFEDGAFEMSAFQG